MKPHRTPERIVVCVLATEGLARKDLLPYLAESDLVDADRYRLTNRALRLLASRALTRWCLVQFIACQTSGSEFGEMTSSVRPAELVVLREKGGKPYLANGPHFSSSSTPGLVACAIAYGQVVGLDVENLDRGKQLNMGRETLYQWTQREAVAKALGLGVGLAMEGLEACGISEVRVTSTSEVWNCERFSWGENYVGAVAMIPENEFSLQIYEVSILAPTRIEAGATSFFPDAKDPWIQSRPAWSGPGTGRGFHPI